MNITVSADDSAKIKSAYSELVETFGIETITLALIESMDTTATTIPDGGRFATDGSGTTTLKAKLDILKTKYDL